MAQFVKLPSGKFVDMEKIIIAYWGLQGGLTEPPPRAFRVYLAGYGECIFKESEDDSLALWRWLCEHSDVAT